MKIFAAGTAAAASGVAALGTAAVKSYSDYEQLVGGIETLFGAGGAASVQEYADSVGKSVSDVQDEFNMLMEAQTTAMDNASKAYQTAGLSANEYMETVTSFAASLKASTENEVEAAKVADQAVIDMADNANKMGTNMESIQNAYQGFAKQNYTMLDNLKLGYGGTKEEMQRLLEDAQKLSGQKYELGNLSDVYAAIHVIQDELGITGTTAKEASTTIQGSVNAMKASWTNLVTGLADDNANFDELIDNFVESATTAATNILPRVEIAIDGIGKLIESLLPIVVAKIPEIINNMIPGLLESGINMVNILIQGIQSNFPAIVDGALAIIEQLTSAFISMLPQIAETGLQIILQLVLGIAQALPELIPQIVDVALTIAETLIDNIDLLVEAAIALMVGLTEGIINALPQLIERIPDIVIAIGNALITNIPILLTAIGECFLSLMGALDDLTGNLFSNILSGLKEFLSRPGYYISYALGALIGIIANHFLKTAESLQNFFTKTIPEKWNQFVKWLSRLPEKAVSFFKKLPEEFFSIGENIISGIWNSLSSGWKWLTDKVSELASGLIDGVKAVFGIHSPSKEFAWIGKMCVAGFDNEMEDFGNMDGIQKNIHASLKSMKMNARGWSNEGIAGLYHSGSTNIDYQRMAAEIADANMTALEKGGFKMVLDNRVAGRIVRSYT